MADNKSLLRFCIFAGLILLHNVTTVLIRKPQNTEAVVGSRVEIFCTTSEPYSIDWEHTPVGDNSPKDVYHGSKIISPYDERLKVKVNPEIGEYVLIFSSVQKEDAGRYECTDGAGLGERQAAELVILESTPQCREEKFVYRGIVTDNDCSLDPEVVGFECSLHYTGNQEPKLRWLQKGGIEVIPRNTATRSLPDHIIVSVSIRPTLQEDGGSYTCQTIWSNISWTSPPIKLLYAFNAAAAVETIHEPTHLSCSVNSSQRCSYEWIHNDKTLTTQRTLEINNPGLYTCIARCRIRDHDCVVKAKVVEFVTVDASHSNDSPSQYIPIAVTVISSVIGGALITAIIVGLIFIFGKKRNSGDKTGHLNFSSRILITKTPSMQIQGIASDGYNLYIIRRREKNVLVYTLAEPSKLLREIEITNLDDPRDIAANTKFLIVTDAAHGCVWKMTRRLGMKFTKLIEKVLSPYTISVNSSDEILMAQMPNELHIYDSDGSRKHRIKLAGITSVYHAIQASSDTIAVSVILDPENNKTHGIILVSTNLHDTPIQKKYIGGDFGVVRQPYHLTTNEEGSIYVADYGNARILILDKDLKPIQAVPFSSSHVRPTRLQYTKQQLIVGQNNYAVQFFGSRFLEGLKTVSQLSESSEEINANDTLESSPLIGRQ